MLPIVICKHYDVEWIDADTCYCPQCGRQGHWTKEGYSIWIHADMRTARSYRGRRHEPCQRVA